MSESNGASELGGWVIVLYGSRNFLGRPSGDTLSPVFELITSVTPQGAARLVVPVLFMDIRELTFPQMFPRISVDSLALEERRILARGVVDASDVIRKMRAAASGILVPGKGSMVKP